MDEAVDGPWATCLSLAWTAYRAGTVPVGAVVVAPDGSIVAEGRNRIFDGGSRLDHAEVDALRHLPVDRRFEDHTVLSVLEPCLLCVGASLLSTVGGIRYAAVDPYGGACHGTIDVPDYVRRQMRIEGPVGGVVGAVTTALQAAFWTGRTTPRSREIAAEFGADLGRRIRAADLPESFEEALPRLLELL